MTCATTFVVGRRAPSPRCGSWSLTDRPLTPEEPGRLVPGRLVDLRPHPPHHPGMDRRRFLLISLAGAFAAPLAVEAQAGKIPKIGWLTSSLVHAPNVEAFREGMSALGYPEVRLEVRAAAGRVDRLSALAAELLSLNVDIIVTDGGPAATAAKQATATTPIVIGAATTEFLMRQELVSCTPSVLVAASMAGSDVRAPSLLGFQTTTRGARSPPQRRCPEPRCRNAHGCRCLPVEPTGANRLFGGSAPPPRGCTRNESSPWRAA